MKTSAFVLAVLFGIASCAPTIERMTVPLNPGGELEVVKAEPDWRSIVVVGIVRDETGKVQGVVPGRGVTKAEILIEGVEAITTISAPFILGNKILKAAGKMDTDTTITVITGSE